jgi:hypothetical protein
MALTRLGLNQAINLATNTTGTLAVGNGGTGLTSGFINGTTNVGKILQIKTKSSGGTQTNINSTSMQRPIHSGYYLEITPTTTGNKIICLGGFDTNTETMGVYYNIEFCVSSDGGSNWGDITSSQRAYMYLTGATRMEHNHNYMSGTHTTANTNAHRFSFQGLSGNGTTTFYPNARTSITLLEVAQ